MNVIHPNQVVKCRKARLDLMVVGWRTFNTVTVAQRYNVGDPDYASKLDYCIGVFKRLKR